MALADALSTMSSTALEAISLVWMELAMFGVAAVVYAAVLGLPQLTRLGRSPASPDYLGPKSPRRRSTRCQEPAKRRLKATSISL